MMDVVVVVAEVAEVDEVAVTTGTLVVYPSTWSSDP